MQRLNNPPGPQDQAFLLNPGLSDNKNLALGVPLWLSRLKIQRCHRSRSGCCYGVRSIPGPGIACMLGSAKKEKNWYQRRYDILKE